MNTVTTKRQMMGSTTSFARLFEFTKNHKFGFLYISESENHGFCFFEKRSESKNFRSPLFFLNLKGFTGSMTNPAVLWVVIYFPKNLRIVGIYVRIFIFFRTLLMNPKNHTNNLQESVPVSNNCWTLASTSIGETYHECRHWECHASRHLLNSASYRMGAFSLKSKIPLCAVPSKISNP